MQIAAMNSLDAWRARPFALRCAGPEPACFQPASSGWKDAYLPDQLRE